MKKKHVVIMLIMAILLILLLPLIIMWLYDLGDVYPIIQTPYSETDMLSYATAVIGAAVSATALIYSIVSNAMRFRITHAITCNEKDEECVLIRIYNDSPYECEILSVSLTNKLHNRSGHIVRGGAFSIRAKSGEEFPVTIDYARKVINGFSKEDVSNALFYELRLGTGSVAYINADKLLQTIDMVDAHKKRFGFLADSDK